jgi:hypothetical protein
MRKSRSYLYACDKCSRHLEVLVGDCEGEACGQSFGSFICRGTLRYVCRLLRDPDPDKSFFNPTKYDPDSGMARLQALVIALLATAGLLVFCIAAKLIEWSLS